MKALEEKIVAEGKVLPGDVLKVGNFLNQQIDVPFMMEMGKEIAILYENCGVNKILTVEASGIALAMAAAYYLHCNVVFAKKSKTTNMDPKVYSAKVYSYTHNVENQIVVSRDFLCQGDKVLLVDDFLANGEALCGMIALCSEAGAKIAGCAVAIEKGFQNGGKKVHEMGIQVQSLAKIASMDENNIVFA